jgi:hypothetical protein
MPDGGGFSMPQVLPFTENRKQKTENRPQAATLLIRAPRAASFSTRLA